MYLRYYITIAIFAIAYVVGMIIHPLVYLQKFMGGGIFWFWANRTESNNFDNWHGDAGWRKKYGLTKRSNIFKKYFVSYIWLALRNSHFNLKKLLFPLKGKRRILVDVKEYSGDLSQGKLVWRNPNYLGKTHVIVKDEKGRKSFMKSGAYKKGNNVVYYQYGAGRTRYHFKRISRKQ